MHKFPYKISTKTKTSSKINIKIKLKTENLYKFKLNYFTGNKVY